MVGFVVSFGSVDPPPPEPPPESPDPPSESFLMDKLGITTDAMVDDSIFTKARGVDEFIRKQIEGEQLRDSSVSYETILDRFTIRLPESFERMGIKPPTGVLF